MLSSHQGAKALYHLGLACLFTHELDAVVHAEWRFLYFLRNMPDETASVIFVALHVPLFFGILWLSHHRLATVRERTRMTVAVLLIVHAVLHYYLFATPQYDFVGVLSNTLIVLAAACGLAYLPMQLHQRRREPS